MALVVGCNYPGVPGYVLHGCHNDALAMREVLITRFGFDSKHVELVIDKPGSPIMPTGANIKRALNKMIDRAEQGDVLFFHFSGHGMLIQPPYAPKEEEVIIASDKNIITSVDFRQLVNRVPKGATFTILADSCQSGGLIDKEKEQIGPDTTPRNPNNTKPRMIPFQSFLQYFTSLTGNTSTDIGTHMVQVFGDDASLMFHDDPIKTSLRPLKPDEGILLSGCQKDEYSDDLTENVVKPCGAFSNAVQMVLKENPGRGLSNREIVMMARKILKRQENEDQHPCLYCSDRNANAVFLGIPTNPPHA
ncbi:hypothetical protein DH2020_014040 [Rehmannia glutinosa]|uniref:Peptidase C14 caspase domain-containing protein n=1 Tax=Rehmannia glutinosa TaxID=99300 RepID=A0ABR0WYW1_REHGL